MITAQPTDTQHHIHSQRHAVGVLVPGHISLKYISDPNSFMLAPIDLVVVSGVDPGFPEGGGGANGNAWRMAVAVEKGAIEAFTMCA